MQAQTCSQRSEQETFWVDSLVQGIALGEV
jgi:hypothetical protein